ncbi:hypothetical protein HA466_0137970 [Hirschfeldia incana]|nr:hypothetical protein HA466_0137970 [Hirschfeldia incana]
MMKELPAVRKPKKQRVRDPHRTQTVSSAFGENLKRKRKRKRERKPSDLVGIAGSEQMLGLVETAPRNPLASTASSLPPSQPRPPSSKQTAKLIVGPPEVQIQRDQALPRQATPKRKTLAVAPLHRRTLHHRG